MSAMALPTLSDTLAYRRLRSWGAFIVCLCDENWLFLDAGRTDFTGLAVQRF